jgi:hypothetical protein
LKKESASSLIDYTSFGLQLSVDYYKEKETFVPVDLGTDPPY